MSDAAIRVVIADDHAIVREGTAELMERAGIDIVGQASTGDEAAALTSTLHPDVLVLDITMPGLPWTEVIGLVAQRCPDTGVLMLSAHEEEPYVRTAMAAGARGYLSKVAPGTEVVEAVRSVAAGRMVLAPALAARVLTASEHRGPEPALTRREREVLAAAARGLANKQIASELVLSPRTVQTHLTNVFGKLGVSSRTEAVLYAIRQGWVRPDGSAPGA